MMRGRYRFGSSSISPLRMASNSRLRAVVDLQFVEDVPDVILHGLFAQIKIVGDLLVGFPVGNQSQNRNLSFGQIMLGPRRLLPFLLCHQ